MQRLGRYEIVSEVGRGGMGVVYRGLDSALGRTVAIKTIRLSEHATPQEVRTLRERLLREARTAGTLRNGCCRCWRTPPAPWTTPMPTGSSTAT